ncbi:MAG: hypothetical protein V1743_02745 [Nanoarchaeota archaeon]
MEYQPKRVETPDFRLIERSLTGNYIFEDEDIEVILRTATNSQEGTFEIALSAKRKLSDLCFRVETRVALEQHSSSGHQYPHLQINNFASDEEVLKKGTLHIVLLVQSKEELEECCNGFMFNVSHILELIENAFDIKKNLREFFFNVEPLNDLRKFSNKLHELIYLSFKVNALVYADNELELVQFKGKKNEPSFDAADIFKILRILLQLKFLNPILLDPLLQLIKEDPQIQSKCPHLDVIECKTQLLKKDASDLKHYNKDEFMKEFNI